MLYLDKYSNLRLMKGREHPHFLLSTITANFFVYAQAFEFFFSNFQVEMQGSYAKSLLTPATTTRTNAMNKIRMRVIFNLGA
jgi:hypothetical protein